MDKESDTGRVRHGEGDMESERVRGRQGYRGVRQGEEGRDLHSAGIGSKGE